MNFGEGYSTIWGSIVNLDLEKKMLELLILCSGWICVFSCFAFCWAVNSFVGSGWGPLVRKNGILKTLHDLNISQWLAIFQISTIHGTQLANDFYFLA